MSIMLIYGYFILIITIFSWRSPLGVCLLFSVEHRAADVHLHSEDP